MVCFGRCRGWHCSSISRCRALSAFLCFVLPQQLPWRIVFCLTGLCAQLSPPAEAPSEASGAVFASEEKRPKAIAPTFSANTLRSASDHLTPFTEESIHWWSERDALQPQKQRLWKVIGQAMKINTASSCAGRQRFQAIHRLDLVDIGSNGSWSL